MCKCKACDFCSHGPPCFSSVEGDSSFEQCDTFCSADYAQSHCSMCKCKQCGFCSALATSPAQLYGQDTCKPANAQDVSVLDCQDYCSADYRDSHCAECKCKGCDFCGCKSEHEGDSKFDECADWCSVDFFSSHCRRAHAVPSLLSQECVWSHSSS